MRTSILPSLLALLASLAPAASPLDDARSMRRERKLDGDKVEVTYRYEEDGQYVSSATQAARRGAEGAKAWAAFRESGRPLAVIGRSPYGGGETRKSYWPAEVDEEALRVVVEPLTRQGLEVVLPDLPASRTGPATLSDDLLDQLGATEPAPAWPRHGFADPEDYPFVLIVGMHHEEIPHKSTRRTVEGKVVYNRSSRMNAWAILFHTETATALWGTISRARVGYGGVADAVNASAEQALAYLSFADIGKDNLPARIAQLPTLEELEAIDLAAMLVQTQRADAVAGVIKTATSKHAHESSAAVLRYFDDRGRPQDFRIDDAYARRRRYALVSQKVMLRLLFLEQLRSVRSIPAAALVAKVPREADFQMGRIGEEHAGETPPYGPDEEVVLIGELADGDRQHVFRRNHHEAVRHLGKVRTHIPEAMAVARTYADRKVRRDRKGRVRRDRLKEAGQRALKELQEALAERRKQP
jgi:hypothetical protein